MQQRINLAPERAGFQETSEPEAALLPFLTRSAAGHTLGEGRQGEGLMRLFLVPKATLV